MVLTRNDRELKEKMKKINQQKKETYEIELDEANKIWKNKTYPNTVAKRKNLIGS